MQDAYVGNLGDFAKYSLLRALTGWPQKKSEESEEASPLHMVWFRVCSDMGSEVRREPGLVVPRRPPPRQGVRSPPVRVSEAVQEPQGAVTRPSAKHGHPAARNALSLREGPGLPPPERPPRCETGLDEQDGLSGGLATAPDRVPRSRCGDRAGRREGQRIAAARLPERSGPAPGTNGPRRDAGRFSKPCS